MVARGLLVAAVAVVGLAQTGDKVFTVPHNEGAGKSNAVKERVKQQGKASDRTLSPRSAEPRVVVASIEAPGVAVALRSESDFPKLARPRLLSVDGYAQVAALGALAAADYHSTRRAFANVPTGREANPILSCGGQLCSQRYWALNAGLIGANYAINRFVVPRLSPRGRRALSVIQWGAIGWRGYVVAHNYRAGGAR